MNSLKNFYTIIAAMGVASFVVLWVITAIASSSSLVQIQAKCAPSGVQQVLDTTFVASIKGNSLIVVCKDGSVKKVR